MSALRIVTQVNVRNSKALQLFLSSKFYQDVIIIQKIVNQSECEVVYRIDPWMLFLELPAAY